MRLELVVPFILGTLLGVMGLALIFDAWTPDHLLVSSDRRKRPRAGRNRTGEAAIGLGVLCLAAALFGRDSWRYSIVAAIAGAVLLLSGALLSHKYVGETIARRGGPGLPGVGEMATPSHAHPESQAVSVGAPREGASQAHDGEPRLRIR